MNSVVPSLTVSTGTGRASAAPAVTAASAARATSAARIGDGA